MDFLLLIVICPRNVPFHVNKNSYLYSLTLHNYIILPVSVMCLLPNMPKAKPNEMSSWDSSYNFGNKKYIPVIPAFVNDGLARSSTGNNDEIWTIWKYWRITRSRQKLNKSNFERHCPDICSWIFAGVHFSSLGSRAQAESVRGWNSRPTEQPEN